MTMIEKVARALCDGNWDARDFTETASGESPEDQREYWLGKARDALEAMREPTPEMLAAFVDGDDPGYTEDWQAMLDAALAEPSPERNE